MSSAAGSDAVGEDSGLKLELPDLPNTEAQLFEEGWVRAANDDPGGTRDGLGPVTLPAYEGATVGVRSLTEWWLSPAEAV